MKAQDLLRNILFTFLCFALLSTKVEASNASDGGYEEVSYDDLVNRLNQKRTQVVESHIDPFSSIMIHAGFGLISSASSVSIQGHSNTKFQNGFQLSLGIDLFTPEFTSEGVIRNFGTSRSGTETRSLREFDLKFLYRSMVQSQAGIRAGMGLGTRYFKLQDDYNGNQIDDSTPIAILFGGIDVFANRNLSFGFETGFRSAMVTRTTDKNSVDLTLRLDSYF